MYFVYILERVNFIPKKGRRNYYIGFSWDVLKRLEEHNSPLQTGYTKNGEWKIVYFEAYYSKYVALDREKKLKQFGNVWKGVMKKIKHNSSELVT